METLQKSLQQLKHITKDNFETLLKKAKNHKKQLEKCRQTP